ACRFRSQRWLCRAAQNSMSSTRIGGSETLRLERRRVLAPASLGARRGVLVQGDCGAVQGDSSVVQRDSSVVLAVRPVALVVRSASERAARIGVRTPGGGTTNVRAHRSTIGGMTSSQPNRLSHPLLVCHLSVGENTRASKLHDWLDALIVLYPTAKLCE